MSSSSEINAVQCACGIRIERQYPALPPVLHDLRSESHDPIVCSERVGYGARLRGRMEMVEVVMGHLVERGSLAAEELREIRPCLIERAAKLP